MNTENTIRRLFATLENAVRSIAGIDATSSGLRDWFRSDHHIQRQERWNVLRELRSANNRNHIVWYAEILDDVSAMLESVNAVYERSIPKFPQVTFDDRTLEPIDATRELLSAVIDWHSADGGYWEYQDATNADNAQEIQAQIELSESLYPMREAEGRELIQKLRHARGLMLLTLDTMPGQRPPVDENAATLVLKLRQRERELLVAMGENRLFDGEAWTQQEIKNAAGYVYENLDRAFRKLNELGLVSATNGRGGGTQLTPLGHSVYAILCKQNTDSTKPGA